MIGLYRLNLINVLTFVVLISAVHYFDTVSVFNLLHKINVYRLKGKLYDWLTDFLPNKNVCAKVGNSLSNCFLQTIGMAQSTCLGLICFTVYINDLPSAIKFSKNKLFADDVKISYDFVPCDLTDDLNSNES